MNCVIIEDEAPAAKRLHRLLDEAEGGYRILAVLDSIEASVEWFERYPQPDLIFMDIHLADGYSFEIFKRTTISAPVIFTTAYDEYALKAFEVNSIDYLLKPIDEGKLDRSIKKLAALQGRAMSPVDRLEQALKSIQGNKNYKTRFLIKLPEKLLTIEERQIAYFMAAHKLVLLTTRDNRHFPVDHTLDELESLLDPGKFFRLNRQLIAAFDSIAGIFPYFNGKLKIHLNPEIKEAVYVSREKAGAFKQWLEGV